MVSIVNLKKKNAFNSSKQPQTNILFQQLKNLKSTVSSKSDTSENQKCDSS